MSPAKTDEVFARFAARYSHAWTSQYVGDGGEADDAAAALAVAEWSQILAGLSDLQLRCGFRADALRGDHWPPSASEFAAMCHGIPGFAEVKLQLARPVPSRTSFTRLVWSLLDTFQFTRADGVHADKLLAEAYALARNHVMAGHPLPEVPSGMIEAKPNPRTPAKPETVAAAFAKMRAVLHTPNEEPIDEARAYAGCDAKP